MTEQFELESLLPEQKNMLREILQGQNVFVNFLTGLPVSSKHKRCTAVYSEIAATHASANTNQEIMIHM